MKKILYYTCFILTAILFIFINKILNIILYTSYFLFKDNFEYPSKLEKIKEEYSLKNIVCFKGYL
jgi:hypothetical protein